MNKIDELNRQIAALQNDKLNLVGECMSGFEALKVLLSSINGNINGDMVCTLDGDVLRAMQELVNVYEEEWFGEENADE